MNQEHQLSYLATYLLDGEVIEIPDELIEERLNICNSCDKKQTVKISVPNFRLKTETNENLQELIEEQPEMIPDIYAAIVDKIVDVDNYNVKESELYEVEWNYPEKDICSHCGCGLKERTEQIIGYCPLFKWKFGPEEWEKYILPQIEKFIEENGSDPIEWRKREENFE